MAWQYHPVLILFFSGGLIALGVALFSLQYIRRHGFSYLVAGVGLFGFHNAIWAFAAALKTVSTGLGMKLFFYKLQFLGSGVTPSITVVIALALVGWDRWITRRLLAVLVVVPAIFVPLVLVNPQDLLIVDPILIQARGIIAFEHSFPPLFVLLLAWGLSVVTIASTVIAYGTLKRNVHWQPAVVAILVFMLPVVFISLKVGQVYPPDGQGVNVTPAVNAIALGLLAGAITRFRIFELLPVARDQAIDVMEDGYVLVGSDDVVLDANPAATEFLTVDAEETLIHEPIHDVLPVYASLEDPDAEDRAVFDVDERIIEVRRSIIPRQYGSGGSLLLLQDITDQRKRQRILERTNERLDQFASVVTHDLRNPLNVAKGRIELAREDDADDHLEAVDTALDRMETLIDDVLELARQGQPISETEAVTLSSVARQCWAVIDSHDATLTIDRDCSFQADNDRLQRLFENLFRNAIEHGGSEVTIRLGSLSHGGGFYIADDGTGIPEDRRTKVFESGYSTADEGTGLGLSIVEEIVDAHGWNIDVSDSLDGGARFEITAVDTIDD